MIRSMADISTPIEPVELRAGGLRLRQWREDDANAYWTALESPGGRLWHGSTLATQNDVVAALARRRDWTSGPSVNCPGDLICCVDDCGGFVDH